MKKKTWNDIYKSGDFAPGLNPSDFVKESIIGVPVTAGPILDVGCGLGRHLIYLASNGFIVALPQHPFNNRNDDTWAELLII